MVNDTIVAIKGAGDLATGVAIRLWRCGFPVVLSELEQPLCIRRSVTFAEAVYEGSQQVEDATALRISEPGDAFAVWEKNRIPVLVDPGFTRIRQLSPAVVIDGRILKKSHDTRIDEAGLVIGLGPGFTAGVNVHAVIETNRGHYMGRVFWRGSAEKDTGEPGEIKGVRSGRVIYAPAAGTFHPLRKIGEFVEAGELVADVDGTPVMAGVRGILRGLLHGGLTVTKGLKIGDVDPRGVADHCWTVSEKALAVGGGVIEAILTWHAGRMPRSIA